MINTHLKDTLKKGLVNNDILLAGNWEFSIISYQPFMTRNWCDNYDLYQSISAFLNEFVKFLNAKSINDLPLTPNQNDFYPLPVTKNLYIFCDSNYYDILINKMKSWLNINHK